MTKASQTAAAKPDAPSETSQQLTLTEFCIRLSQHDKRVVLIGGFEATERKAGRIKDSEAAYQARFAEFTNKPA